MNELQSNIFQMVLKLWFAFKKLFLTVISQFVPKNRLLIRSVFKFTLFGPLGGFAFVRRPLDGIYSVPNWHLRSQLVLRTNQR